MSRKLSEIESNIGHMPSAAPPSESQSPIQDGEGAPWTLLMLSQMPSSNLHRPIYSCQTTYKDARFGTALPKTLRIPKEWGGVVVLTDSFEPKRSARSAQGSRANLRSPPKSTFTITLEDHTSSTFYETRRKRIPFDIHVSGESSISIVSMRTIAFKVTGSCAKLTGENSIETKT